MSENGCCVVCVYRSRGLYKLVTEVWNGLKRRLIQCCLMQLFFLCSLGQNEYSVQSLCETLGQMSVLFNFCDHLFVIVWVK